MPPLNGENRGIQQRTEFLYSVNGWPNRSSRSSSSSGRATGAPQAVKGEFACTSRYSDAKPEQCGELQFLSTNDPGQLAADFGDEVGAVTQQLGVDAERALKRGLDLLKRGQHVPLTGSFHAGGGDVPAGRAQLRLSGRWWSGRP